jgi:hypothetical protein
MLLGDPIFPSSHTSFRKSLELFPKVNRKKSKFV